MKLIIKIVAFLSMLVAAVAHRYGLIIELYAMVAITYIFFTGMFFLESIYAEETFIKKQKTNFLFFSLGLTLQGMFMVFYNIPKPSSYFLMILIVIFEIAAVLKLQNYLKKTRKPLG